MIPKCICCGADEVACVGTIPPFIFFSGQLLNKPIAGGQLFYCRKCGMSFRYPRLDKEKLDALYLQGNPESWQDDPSAREDWQIARQWIMQHLPVDCRILDVGCFDGGFLKTFETSYGRFGIEIHEAAGQRAHAAGIQIIGRDFDNTNATKSNFDTVTSFDVIEHTQNPLDFLKDMVNMTREGGYVIVSTGNSDSFSWGMIGARYWYCSIGEHMSFINPRWCKWAGNQLGLELKQIIKFSHGDTSWKQRLEDVLKNLIYAAFPGGFSILRQMGMGGDEFRSHKEMLSQPPSWMSAKDHFICIFQKNVP